MGKLKSHMIDFMTTRGYSEKTIKCYTSCVSILAREYCKSPLTVTSAEIETFLHGLREKRKSLSTIRTYYEALKYFYRMHGLEQRLPPLTFRGTNNRKPIILGQRELYELLRGCRSLKHRTILTVIYSAGLRISEAINLTVSDINFERNTIFVKNGKNGKDRYTILGKEAARLLRDYISVYHPTCHIFYSKDVLTKISPDCIRRHFSKLLSENRINGKIHIHTLRHCFATHLIENGTGLFRVMRLLGHTNIQTTMKYLHLTAIDLDTVTSPLDHTIESSEKKQIDSFTLESA